MKRKLTRALAAMAAVAVATVAYAADGRVAGQVNDQAGKPLEGVLVTIRALEVTYERSSETNKKGKFTLVVLDAGRTYDIELVKDGYGTIKEPIKLSSGGTVRKAWTMVQGGSGPPESMGEDLLGAAEARGKALKVWEKGRDAYGAGDLDAAAAAFQEALEIEPELGAAYAGLARVALDRKQWEEGLRNAERLRELAPEEVLGMRMVHDAYRGLGREEEAEEMLDTLIELDRTGGTAARVYNSAVSSIREMDYERALTRLEQTVSIDPELKEAYVPLGQIYLSKKEGQKALEAAQKLQEIVPGHGRGLVLLYRAHVELGNPEQAEEALGTLAGSDPDTFVRTFMESGSEDFNAGETAAAIDSFEKVFRVAPDHPRAHYMLGLAWAGSDPDKAKEHLRRFMELSPEDPEVETAKAMIAGL